MSAVIFAFSPFHLADAVSLEDLMFWFTFWTACSALACACATRATTLSCASFCAAATASSVLLTRTDKLASCSEIGFIVHPLCEFLCVNLSSHAALRAGRCRQTDCALAARMDVDQSALRLILIVGEVTRRCL